MSATLENPNIICSFIDAHYIEYTQRLNQLEEFAIVNKERYNIGGVDPIDKLDSAFDIASDTNAVIGLAFIAQRLS